MDNQFYVEKANVTWNRDRFATMELAQVSAQKKAWRDGEDYAVFKAVAVAAKPEAVNSVVVKPVTN